MTNPRSNSRRFVNAAWSLLTFQLIASAGAVAVTGVAAFHVSNLVNGAQQADAPAEAAVEATAPAAEPAPAATDPAPPAPTGPVNDGAGTLTLTQDGRGNIIASLRDPDGAQGAPRILWLRDGVPIAGATGPSYALNPNYDWGHAISARADYVDDDGFPETAISAPMPLSVGVQ